MLDCWPVTTVSYNKCRKNKNQEAGGETGSHNREAGADWGHRIIGNT